MNNQEQGQALTALDQWPIDPSMTFLNHGSFGACPHSVLQHQTEIRLEMERSPVRFNLTKLPHLLQAARDSISVHIGADSQSFVFVNNASEGVATALNCIDWQAGDEVVISQDSYPACQHMLDHLAKHYGIVIKQALTPFGGEQWTHRVFNAFKAQCSQHTRLILIDHITSPTALIYPVKALIRLAKKIGAISIVDGAHAPGQLALDIEGDLQPDFYTGNAHKWMMTPKSVAILYVAPHWRERITPLVISHGYLAEPSERFQALFDWTGTRDYSAIISLPKTIEWILEQYESFDQLRHRNHELLVKARRFIIDQLWSQQSLRPHHPPLEALGHMAAILLPPSLADYVRPELNSDEPLSSASAGRLHPLQLKLWSEGFEVPIITTSHGVIIRISVQAYNDLSQYQALSRTLLRLL